MAEYRRFDVITFVQAFWSAWTASNYLGAFFNTGADQILNLVPLRFGDDWTDDSIFSIRIARLYLGGDGFGDGGYFVHTAVWHQHTSRRVAGLTAVVHARHDTVSNHFLEIDIVQQNVGRLTAQLQRDALDSLCTVLHHLTTRASGTSERHHVDILMGGHGRADGGAIAVNQVEYASRNASFVEYFG